jgi:hypothetical protein
MLEDRDLTIRIYPDPESAPDRSVLVQVPVRRQAIEFSAVKAAYPPISESACILIQAPDQTDKDVATVLDRYVYLQRYSPNQRRIVGLLDDRRQWVPSWTFLDALGEPMAGAKITLFLSCGINVASLLNYGEEDVASIGLSGGTLDDAGQLAAFRVLGGTVTMKLEHPDYGVATVQARSGAVQQEGIYVVPVVPRDSPACSAALSGRVTDTEGRPLAGMPVFVAPNIGRANSDDDCYEQLFTGRVITDEQGRFTLCRPTLSKDLAMGNLPAPGTVQVLRIVPPKSSNLRRLSYSAFVGTPTTLTLTAMDAQEVFRTFSFEYYDGPVTDPDELAGMTLTLQRDGREWRTLTFDQFANGCYLPPGTLSARTTRWGKPFEFMTIELKTDSAEHLVFKSRAPVLYRGRVVEFGTNRPLPGVFVLADHSLRRAEPSELTAEQWQRLAAQAKIDGVSEEGLHQRQERVAVTDENGVFEIVFAPMGGSDRFIIGTGLSYFTALAPGYAAPPAARPRSGADRQIMTVPTLELCRPGMVYFPQFVFEDENGPVTDPNRLGEIDLTISDSGWAFFTTIAAFLQDREFVAGNYRSQVIWDGKRYTFDSADLTTARPDTVVFKPASIEPLDLGSDVTYRGRVVDATTGKPLGGAIAVCSGSTSPPGIKGLRPEEWAAIRALGPNPDPSNPAFARFWVASAVRQQDPSASIAISDSDGWFELSTGHSQDQRTAILWVLAQDYLAGFETLAVIPGRRGGVEQSDTRRLRFAPDEHGVAILPTFSLVPAATVVIHPVVPDPGHANRIREPILRWSAPPDEPAAEWANALNGHRGGIRLEPNIEQVALVPTDVTLRLRLESPATLGFVNLSLGRIRLAKGQIHDLGRIEFSSGIDITVKVIDGAGRPLGDVAVSCMDEEMWIYFKSGRTDEHGVAHLNTPAHTVGRIRASGTNPLTDARIEESIPFQIGSAEDTGKEFTLRLSEAFVEPLQAGRP